MVLIDPDHAAAATLATRLGAAGYAVTVTADGIAGLLAVEELHPALVLVAWDLPLLPGTIVAQALKVGLDQPPLVVALATPGAQPAPVVGDGVAAVVPRHPTADALLAVVASLLAPPADSGAS